MRKANIVEYYSAIKKNKPLIHATTESYLKCCVPSKRSQMQKAKYFMSPSIRHSRKGTIIGIEKRSALARSWQWRERLDCTEHVAE